MWNTATVVWPRDLCSFLFYSALFPGSAMSATYFVCLASDSEAEEARRTSAKRWNERQKQATIGSTQLLSILLPEPAVLLVPKSDGGRDQLQMTSPQAHFLSSHVVVGFDMHWERFGVL